MHDNHDVLERLLILLYDRTSSEEVNVARKQLFAQKGRPMDGLPPTKAALKEHTKELHTRQVMSGPPCFFVNPTYHLLLNGDGCKQTMEVGK